MANQNKPLNCSSVDVNLIKLNPVSFEGKFNQIQGSAFINYDKRRSLDFMTQIIEIDEGGIPILNEKTMKWYGEEYKRRFIRIPYTETDDGSAELFDLLKKIDDYVEKNKELLLGKKNKKYVYSKLFKPKNKEEEDDEDEEFVKKPRLKARFEVNRDTQEIITSIFVKENGPNSAPVQHDCKTVADIEQHIPLGSKIRLVLSLKKVWAQKPTDENPKFGIIVACKSIVVEEKGTGVSSGFDYKNNYVFGGAMPVIKEKEKENTKEQPKQKQEPKQEEKETEEFEEEEEEEEVEEEEEEEVEEEEEEEEEVEEEEEEDKKVVNVKETKKTNSKK